MATTIRCNQCQNQIEITEAIREELKAKVLQDTKKKHLEEISKLKNENADYMRVKDKELEDFKSRITESARRDAIDKVRKEYDYKIKLTKEDAIEQEKQNKSLQNDMTKLVKELRETKDEKGKLEIEYQKKHLEEINKLKQEKEDIKREKEKELEDSKIQITESARRDAIDKARKDYDYKIKLVKEESIEQEKQNKSLQNDMTELVKELRETKDEKGKLEIEYQKKLLDEEDNIKQKAKKEAQEELDLKIAEKDKKLSDATKQILELQRKLEQGSQQLQGEVLEINIEKLLKDNFPHDIIEPIKKGEKGADIRQTVISPKGYPCGVILWESKRTKTWSNTWLVKLKDDLRAENANIPVIVSTTLPKEIDNDMGLIDKVWVSTFSLSMPLARLLRQNLLDVYRSRVISVLRGEKAEHLYEYITSHKFIQQVEAMGEVYHKMKSQIGKERIAYERMWAEREKQVDKLFTSTAKIVGSISGEVDKTAFQIKGFELPESDELFNV